MMAVHTSEPLLHALWKFRSYFESHFTVIRLFFFPFLHSSKWPQPCGLQGCNCIPTSLFSSFIRHQKFQMFSDNFNMETIKKCFGAVIKMLLAHIPQWHWLSSYTIHVFDGRQEIGKQIRICLLPAFLPALSSPLLPWGSLSVWWWRKLLCTW